MIFKNNTKEKVLNEQEIIEVLKELWDEENGYLFVCSYNENLNILELNEITKQMLLEANDNISSTKLGVDGNERHVLITKSSNAKHEGRMKISDINKNINKSSKSLTLYMDKNEVQVIGNMKDINIKEKELNQYKELYKRNENLIRLAKHNPSLDDDINMGFISDEDLRKQGRTVTRDINGNATVSKKNKPNEIDYKKDIKGARIW